MREQIINIERILRDQKIAEKWAKLRQFSKEEIHMSGDFLRIEVWHNRGTLMFSSCCQQKFLKMLKLKSKFKRENIVTSYLLLQEHLTYFSRNQPYTYFKVICELLILRDLL